MLISVGHASQLPQNTQHITLLHATSTDRCEYVRLCAYELLCVHILTSEFLFVMGKHIREVCVYTSYSYINIDHEGDSGKIEMIELFELTTTK